MLNLLTIPLNVTVPASVSKAIKHFHLIGSTIQTKANYIEYKKIDIIIMLSA